jgi:hypothetical protein
VVKDAFAELRSLVRVVHPDQDSLADGIPAPIKSELASCQQLFDLYELESQKLVRIFDDSREMCRLDVNDPAFKTKIVLESYLVSSLHFRHSGTGVFILCECSLVPLLTLSSAICV